MCVFNVSLSIISLMAMAALCPAGLLALVRRIRRWLEKQLIQAEDDLPQSPGQP